LLKHEIIVRVLAVLLSESPVLGETRTESNPDIIANLPDYMRVNDRPVLAGTTRLVEGTPYLNFVCTTPLCCPTRVTVQTGLQAHNQRIFRT
jgi:hypothetical protein